MTQRAWLNAHPRTGKALGFGVTLLAAGASLATSYGSDFCRLSLPAQPITLNAEHPEKRSQFLVESSDGRFSVFLELATASQERVHLDVRALGANAARVHLVGVGATADAGVEWLVSVDCPNEFPCVARLEAIVTAEPAATEGILSIAVESAECSSPNNAYLAIEPL